jgi:hypothetical protein
MTDRAQPGAIDSLVRNDELAQALDSFTKGGIVSGSNPTAASIRRSDIDETALNAFSLSSSASSLDVTVAPGEGFIGGWLCRDTSTTLTLPANATTDIVIGHDTDAVFDPAVDPDRDAADEVIIDLAASVAADIPQVVAHRVETDGSGVIGSERIATVGGFSEVKTGDLAVSGTVTEPLSVGNLDVGGELSGVTTIIDVQSESDLPPVDPPQIAFIQAKNEYQRSVNAVTFVISNLTLQNTTPTQENFPGGLAFNDDGTKFYTAGGSNDKIFESSLSTPFDISTATFQQSISSQGGFITGIEFNNNGTKLFEIQNDTIFVSSLSTPFDLTTATFQRSVTGQDSDAKGITFNDDGTRLYEAGGSSSLLYESSLSTPFDLTTATFQQSITSQNSTPGAIEFNNDGTKLFEAGRSGLVFLSTLSSPFDLSTATFQRSTSVQDGSPIGMQFNNDGTKMFIAGRDDDEIKQFASGKPSQFKTF